MSLHIDIKYANLLAPRLELFKVKNHNPFTANCRCPLCGDSKNNKWKARGYFFTKKGGVFYKCHNCGASSSLGNLIKQLDAFLFNQYTMERYKEGTHGKSHANVANVMEFTKPDFESRKEQSLLDSLLDPIDNTKAEEYVRARKIPLSRWKELYYIDDMQKMEQLSEKYKGRIIGSEDRLVIPFYNRQGRFVGVTCRALGDERLRYVTIRINDDEPLVYNLDKVDINRDVYVTEGPLDSLFLDNAVAAGSSDLKAVAKAIPKDKMVLVFDNQPRNVELVKLMTKASDEGYRMVIWPKNIRQKDINEMFLAGVAVKDIINQNTFEGLELKMVISEWKMI
jgi:hypothetical protein